MLKKNPDHPRVLLERGRAYYEMLDYEKANADFDRLIELTNEVPERVYVNALGHLFRGHSYNRKGLYEKALAEYDIAYKYYPDNIDLMLNAISMRIETSRISEAEKMIEEKLHRYSGEVTRTTGGDLNKRQRSILLCFKAKVSAAQSRWDETYALTNEAIKLDPENIRAYDTRAKAYYAQKKYKQALADYRKLNDPRTNDQRGWIAACYFYMGKKKEAIAEMTAYIKDHPKESMGYSTRANFYMVTGDRAKAEADAKAAVEAGVTMPAAHWGLANVYMALGKREEAANEIWQ